jgi:hypothetical protein
MTEPARTRKPKAREGERTVSTRRNNIAKADGAPPKLTDHVRIPLINALKLGSPLPIACAFAEISEQTVERWVALGKLALQKRAQDRTRNERLYANFLPEFEKACADYFVLSQSQLHILGTQPLVDDDGNRLDVSPEEKRIIADANKFHLTHRAKKHYNTQQNVEVTGKDGSPVLDFDAIWERAQVILARQDDGAVVEDE